MAGLEGVRVLELGGLVSAPFAAKMMGDLGADVVKVEPPGGERARRRGPWPPDVDPDAPDLERSGLFLALNANKRSIVLDLAAPEDREAFDGLVASADVLVHNLAPAEADALDLSWERLRAIRPRLVMCSITPFGRTGPYRDYRAEELTVQHGGGWGWLSPGATDFPALPPLKAFGHQADFQAGVAANAASLAALYRARRTGRGEHVDLSSLAYVTTFLEAALIYWTYPGVLASRAGARGLNPWGIYPCRDGLIFLATVEEDQWERLVEFLGAPEWASLEIFAGFRARMENADALRVFLSEWTAEWKVQDLFHEGQKRRICFAPVVDMEEFARLPQLRARDFFARVEHPRAGALEVPGPPYRLGEPWWAIRRPPPLLGEHDAEIRAEARPRAEAPAAPAPSPAPGLPLEGIRVLDLSWVWAGPFAAMHLAHLGAEVIKVESAGRPDLGRRLAVYPKDQEPTLDSSGYFNQWNQGKRSVQLSLSEPGAIEIVRRLVAHCDVLVENFATGVMERLGLGYESLVEIRPDLIMASISGYGETGPWREYMGYGPAISPLSGLSSLSGYPGEGPSEVGLSLGDPSAGITAAAGVCAALVARQQTGRGQHLDVSLLEATAVASVEGWMSRELAGAQPARMANRDPLWCPHGLYACRGEDAWVSIACTSDEEWRQLCSVVDPARGTDPRLATRAARKEQEDEVDRAISAWTGGRDRWEVTRTLQAVGVAAFPCMTPRDLVEDPQLRARGLFERFDHRQVGRRVHAGIAWRLADGPNGVRAPAPLLGADTDAVLGELLGFSPEKIRQLRDDKIVY